MSLQNTCHCNEQLLSELIQAIKTLHSEAYQKPAAPDNPQTIGAHVRHIIEFYHCFLSGLESSYINYDNRTRDPECERNISSAVDTLLSIKKCLAKLTTNTLREVNLTLNANIDTTGNVVNTETSVIRELLFLQSHAIHHMAMINLLLQQSGHSPPKDLGVATSTLIYRKQLEASSEN